MKTTLRITLLLAIIISSQLKVAGNAPDAAALWAGVPDNKNEFVLTTPLSTDTLVVGWQYALHYVHDEQRAGLGFVIAMTRAFENQKFYLALYEKMPPGMDPADFNKMDDSEKRKYASAIKLVEFPFAQAIYEKIVSFLLNARHGFANKSDGNPQMFYISTYSLETGYMSAITSDYKGNKKSKQIVDLGKLLREYIKTTDKKEEDVIIKKIGSS